MVARRENDHDSHRRPTRRRRPSRKAAWLGLGSLVFLVVLLLLPSLVARPALLANLINRYGGIAPLRVELGGVRAGWLTPVSLSNLRLLDGDGPPLVSIAEVTTSKGLLSWIANSRNLQRIRLHQVETTIVADHGTTNLETALAQWLAPEEPETPEEDDQGSPFAGAIELTEARLVLRDAQRPEVWQVHIPQASLTLPVDGQTIGPISLHASVAEQTGSQAWGSGSLAAEIKQGASGAFELRAKLQHLPLEIFHVIKARLPELPIDQLAGRTSAVMAGSLISADGWSLELTGLSTAGLHIDAPTLVGEKAAHMDRLNATGRATLSAGFHRLLALWMTRC